MNVFYLKLLQTILHYTLHLVAPAGIAWYFYRNDWKRVLFVLIATMLVDLDHLLATPILDPTRCSIGFHPLHSYVAVSVYAVIFSTTNNKWVKIITLGLLFHMFTDFIDCVINHQLIK